MKWINAEQRVTVSIYDDEHEEYLDKIMTVEEMLDAYTNEGCPTIYSNPEQTSCGHITDAEYSIIINALNHQKPKERVIAEIKIDEDTLRKIVKDKVDELTTRFATQPCMDCYYNDGEVHAECVMCDKVERWVRNDAKKSDNETSNL